MLAIWVTSMGGNFSFVCGLLVTSIASDCRVLPPSGCGVLLGSACWPLCFSSLLTLGTSFSPSSRLLPPVCAYHCCLCLSYQLIKSKPGVHSWSLWRWHPPSCVFSSSFSDVRVLQCSAAVFPCCAFLSSSQYKVDHVGTCLSFRLSFFVLFPCSSRVAVIPACSLCLASWVLIADESLVARSAIMESWTLQPCLPTLSMRHLLQLHLFLGPSLPGSMKSIWTFPLFWATLSLSLSVSLCLSLSLSTPDPKLCGCAGAWPGFK